MELNTVKLEKVMRNMPHITDEQAREIALAIASTVEYAIDAAFDKRTASLQQSIDRGQENLDAHRRETRDSFAEVRESFVEVRESFAEVRESFVEIRESLVEIRENLIKNEKSIADLETVVEKNAAKNENSIADLETVIERNANQNRKDIFDFQYKIVEMIANQNRMMMTIGGIIIAVVLAVATFS